MFYRQLSGERVRIVSYGPKGDFEIVLKMDIGLAEPSEILVRFGTNADRVERLRVMDSAAGIVEHQGFCMQADG